MKPMREIMMDNIIKRYGFESKETVDFCKMCESDAEYFEICKKYYKLMGCI